MAKRVLPWVNPVAEKEYKERKKKLQTLLKESYPYDSKFYLENARKRIKLASKLERVRQKDSSTTDISKLYEGAAEYCILAAAKQKVYFNRKKILQESRKFYLNALNLGKERDLKDLQKLFENLNEVDKTIREMSGNKPVNNRIYEQAYRKVAGFLSIAAFVFSLFFSALNLTGNMIGNASGDFSILGICFFLCALVFGVFALKKNVVIDLGKGKRGDIDDFVKKYGSNKNMKSEIGNQNYSTRVNNFLKKNSIRDYQEKYKGVGVGKTNKFAKNISKKYKARKK